MNNPSSKYFTVEEELSDGGAVRSIFAIKPSKLAALAGRIRKELPELDKKTAEKCAVVYCRMMTEETNKLAAKLIEQATAVSMRRIAGDLNKIADGIINVTPFEIRKSIKEKIGREDEARLARLRKEKSRLKSNTPRSKRHQ